MPKAKQPPKPTALPEHHCNRVWIEIERAPDGVNLPPAELHTFREKQIELANNLLRRLNPEGSPHGTEDGTHFWWSERDYQYALTLGSHGGYITLSDNGHWFNLDHFGRVSVDPAAGNEKRALRIFRTLTVEQQIEVFAQIAADERFPAEARRIAGNY
jgi:hypothetical protein